MGVHLMTVHFMGVRLIGVHLMGVRLMGVYLTGVRLVSVPYEYASHRRGQRGILSNGTVGHSDSFNISMIKCIATG
jgi:hypothetical protein